MNLGLRVRSPKIASSTSGFGTDELCDFDALDANGVRAICLLLGPLTHTRALYRNELQSPL